MCSNNNFGWSLHITPEVSVCHNRLETAENHVVSRPSQSNEQVYNIIISNVAADRITRSL